ncbi:cyclic nucleotide-binding domain-containing protein [Flavitalea flava]
MDKFLNYVHDHKLVSKQQEERIPRYKKIVHLQPGENLRLQVPHSCMVYVIDGLLVESLERSVGWSCIGFYKPEKYLLSGIGWEYHPETEVHRIVAIVPTSLYFIHEYRIERIYAKLPKSKIEHLYNHLGITEANSPDHSLSPLERLQLFVDTEPYIYARVPKEDIAAFLDIPLSTFNSLRPPSGNTP